MTARFQKLSAARRATITDAIIAEIAERGFESAAVASIAERAQTSKASLFYYFTDRDEMLAAGLEAFFGDLLASGLPSIAAPLFDGDFWSGFEAIYAAFAAQLAGDPVRARFVRAWISLIQTDTTSPTLAAWTARAKTVIESVLAEGVARGAMRRDVPTALLSRAVLAMALAVDAWMAETIAAGGDAREAARVAVALFRSAFGGAAARQTVPPTGSSKSAKKPAKKSLR